MFLTSPFIDLRKFAPFVRQNRVNERYGDITPTIRLSLVISSAFIDLILSWT